MRLTSLVFLCVILSCVMTGAPGPAWGADGESGILWGIIVDAGSGAPLPGRVYARGGDGVIHFAEDGIPYIREQFGDRIGYDGAHFTTVGNTFLVTLPAGEAMVRVEHGKEYLPTEQNVRITAGETVTVTFAVERWADMNAAGWYSGDLHVHRPLSELPDLMRAEDINVAVPQTRWGHKIVPELDTWLGRAGPDGSVAVDGTHVFSVLSHEIERFIKSAVLMHHTGKTLIPVSEHETQGLPNLPLFEMTHEAGGYVDVEKPMWPESHVDVAVGGADFIGLANNHMTYRSWLPEHPRKRDEFRDDYPPDFEGYIQYVCDLYYAYLNCGFRVMPSAGSASGVLPNPLGYNRVYVHLDGSFSYDAWFRALKAGRSFITNGPLLRVGVEGVKPGGTLMLPTGGDGVYVACRLDSYVGIERVECIMNGEVVASVDNPELRGYSGAVVMPVNVRESGWLAVRCFETAGDNIRFAHTAPVFLEVSGSPFVPDRAAAEYFHLKTVDLIEHAGTLEYPSEEAESADLAVYNRALAIYADIIARGE